MQLVIFFSPLLKTIKQLESNSWEMKKWFCIPAFDIHSGHYITTGTNTHHLVELQYWGYRGKAEANSLSFSKGCMAEGRLKVRCVSSQVKS